MNAKRLALYALIPGIAAGVIRRFLWTNIYDEAAKLVTDPVPAMIFNLLLALCGAVLCVIALRSWPEGHIAAPPYGDGGHLSRILRLLSAGCSLAAGILLLAAQIESYEPVLITVVAGVLLIVQSAALLALTLWRERSGRRYATLLLLPSFALCFWLVAFYHDAGSEPNREVYLWPILAGVLTALVWLEYTGFLYQKQSGRLFTAFAVLAILSFPCALAAPLSAGWRISLLGQLLWITAALVQLKLRLPEIDTAEDDPITTPSDEP